MSDPPIVAAWENHQHPVDETEFTPWAVEGWFAWNGQSPELEVCEFVRSLVRMMRPQIGGGDRGGAGLHDPCDRPAAR